MLLIWYLYTFVTFAVLSLGQAPVPFFLWNNPFHTWDTESSSIPPGARVSPRLHGLRMLVPVPWIHAPDFWLKESRIISTIGPVLFARVIIWDVGLCYMQLCKYGIIAWYNHAIPRGLTRPGVEGNRAVWPQASSVRGQLVVKTDLGTVSVSQEQKKFQDLIYCL